jgi:cytochrome c oxidase subunit 1/cytochrome c oxidase subunit I+III
MMWALTVWIAAHALVGAIMQLYCLAGSVFGKLTREYDADLWNTTLFWHFLALMSAVSAAMIGLVPRLM